MIITLPQKLSYKSRYNFKFLHGRTFSSQSRARNLEILGLGENASPQQVKSAYLRLSKEFHPDVNQSASATEEFQRIKSAFDQLQGEKSRNVGSPSASSSAESEKRHQEEKFSTEFQSWKMRQKKTKEFDDWLRKVQSDGRRQTFSNKTSNHEEFNTKFSKTKTDFSHSKKNFSNFKFEERNMENNNSYRTEAYVRYEKNFIARLDYILGLQSRLDTEFNIRDHINRRREASLSFLVPHIWRLLVRSVAYVSMMVVGISSVLGLLTIDISVLTLW